MYHKIIKPFYLILGLIFLALGTIGVVLPLLPTTPFLLLASFFLVKGSTHFHKWFTQTKLYKKYLENFLLTRTMTQNTKIRIVALASTMLLLTFWRVDLWYARLMIIAMLLFIVYYFSCRIKTVN